MRFPSQSNLVCPYLVRSSHIFAKIHAFRECFPKYVWLLYYTPLFNSKCADGTGLTRWYNMSLPSFSLPSTDEEARAKIQQAIGPHENLLTIVKRRKLQSCLPFIRSGQNHLARHSEREKKTRQTEEEMGRQHQGMDRPGVRQIPQNTDRMASRD